MAVLWAYLIFVPVSALCFARLPLRPAILLVLMGGWWLLPVGRYAPVPPGTPLPWWITGIALPSDMLLTKGWIPPAVAIAGAALRDRTTLRAWRPAAIDIPMLAWCLWPAVAIFHKAPDPAPWLSVLYIVGVWGLPWLIGRVWFAGSAGGLALARAIALSGLANLPVAVIEGFRPAMLYGLVYGPHPFRFDGIDRYIGYRPVGFLEHGTLYGLWAALAAFLSVWLALRDRGSADGRRWFALAVINVAVALASQSVGAIALLLVGLVLLGGWRLPIFIPALSGVASLLLLLAVLHFCGVIPLQVLADLPAGERVIKAIRAIGRGSFLWRLSQDTKTLGAVAANPLTGTGRWDWWRPFGTRPWGQLLLLLGQYGLVGLLLAWGALIGAAFAAFNRLRLWRDWLDGDAALPLAIMVLLALADATLNAFFFSPAILAAGAIAVTPPRRRPNQAT